MLTHHLVSSISSAVRHAKHSTKSRIGDAAALGTGLARAAARPRDDLSHEGS